MPAWPLPMCWWLRWALLSWGQQPTQEGQHRPVDMDTGTQTPCSAHVQRPLLSRGLDNGQASLLPPAACPCAEEPPQLA